MPNAPSILVVDDDLDVCTLIVRLLQDAGFTARHAPDGPAALDLVRAAPPAMVLLDLLMPEVTGLDVLRAMRLDPRGRGIPVIVYSGSGDPAHRQAALAMGANDYLVKSVATFDDLRATAARHAPVAAR